MTLRCLGLSALCLSLTLGGTTAIATPPVPHLPLGPGGLTETRDTRTLQPGVTLTTIVRGHTDPNASWTVEVAIPSTSPDPDTPAAALSDRAGADKAAAKLRAAGLDPRVEEVPTPQLADAGGGSLGYRVRLGLLGTKARPTHCVRR